MRALIIETEPCHHEIVPTWVWVLNQLGFQVDILMKTPPPHRDILFEMEHYMKLSFYRVETAQISSYDVVLNNTLYPENDVKHVNTTTKTLSVLHRLPNAKTPWNTNYEDIRRHANHSLIALGPHVKKTLAGTENNVLLGQPVYFGAVRAINDVAKQKFEARRFVIQGSMERFRRNYGTVPELVNSWTASDDWFSFAIIGDKRSDIEKWLKSQITAPDQRQRVEMIYNLAYHDYLECVRSATWIMPMIDETFQHEYFTHKITSSIMMAIGNGTPLILHRQLADIYGLRDGVHGWVYDDGADSRKTTFVKALKTLPDTYVSMLHEIRKLRDDWLTDCKQEFQKRFDLS